MSSLPVQDQEGVEGLDLTQEFGKHWMPAFSAKDSTFMPVGAERAEKGRLDKHRRRILATGQPIRQSG